MSYRSLFESNPLPIWVISRNGFRFLQTNPAATQLFGFTSAEFSSMTLADLHTLAEMEAFKQAVDGQSLPVALSNWRSRTKSGETLDLELKIHPAETRNGSALIVVPLDVRERL